MRRYFSTYDGVHTHTHTHTHVCYVYNLRVCIYVATCRIIANTFNDKAYGGVFTRLVRMK